MNAFRKPILALTVVAVGSVLLGACASSSTANSSSGSAGSASPTLRAQKVGSIGSVLVDSSGLTLYFLKGETAANIQCTGSCATNWPPLTVASGVKPTVGSGVSGKAGTVQRPDGSLQVTYDGKPLYTFAGDSGPGDASGQGVANFFAATPTGSTGNPGSGSSGGYYPSGY
jgi:predicted lipoprotein with Yx(FWY)xxD motif